jgi:hypothetical protein
MLNAEAEQGRIKISNSWNDIAAWIGADTGALEATWMNTIHSATKDMMQFSQKTLSTL